MRKRCSIQQGWKKITLDQSKVLKYRLFRSFWATRYRVIARSFEAPWLFGAFSAAMHGPCSCYIWTLFWSILIQNVKQNKKKTKKQVDRCFFFFFGGGGGAVAPHLYPPMWMGQRSFFFLFYWSFSQSEPYNIVIHKTHIKHYEEWRRCRYMVHYPIPTARSRLGYRAAEIATLKIVCTRPAFPKSSQSVI